MPARASLDLIACRAAVAPGSNIRRYERPRAERRSRPGTRLPPAVSGAVTLHGDHAGVVAGPQHRAGEDLSLVEGDVDQPGQEAPRPGGQVVPGAPVQGPDDGAED